MADEFKRRFQSNVFEKEVYRFFSFSFSIQSISILFRRCENNIPEFYWTMIALNQ